MLQCLKRRWSIKCAELNSTAVCPKIKAHILSEMPWPVTYNTGLPSPQQVVRFTQFVRFRCTSVNCFVTSMTPFLTVHRVFNVELKRESGTATRQGWRLGGGGVQLLLFNLDTRGNEWSASSSDSALPPGIEPSSTHCTEDWVGLRAGLDAKTRWKSIYLRWGLNSSRPVRSETLYGLNYPAHLFLN
jgi:hypothetical protein